MANTHGGYREPTNPAPVSGPGALSRRTDGGGAAGAYGEGVEMAEIQSGAPMAEAAPIDPSGLVPMEAESQYPDVPVTDGVDMSGEGADPASEGDLFQRRDHYAALKWVASQSHASNAFRQFVRQLGQEFAQDGVR